MHDQQPPQGKISYLDNNISINPISMIHSQFTQRYENTLDIKIPQISMLKNKILIELDKGKLISDKGDQKTNLSILLVNHSHNYECILLKVCYGRFQLLVSVLFSEDRRSVHQIFTKFRGNFSTVYKAYIFKQQIAIKCTKFDDETFSEVFGDVLKEYIILKILSRLRLGPRVEKSMGFDIIIGPNCIQFSTQFCQHKLQKANILTISNDLTQILKKLHSLNIIHGDVKTDNICFSSFYKKYVFIDYGLHSILKQTVSQKTYTNFQGTLGFVLPEMEQCLSKEENRYIDLYFNDVYGLTISLDQIKKQLSAIDSSDNFVRNQDITAKILVEYVKGIFIEKYFISQSITNTRNYIKFMKQYQRSKRTQKPDLQCFQRTIKDQNNYSITSLQRLQAIYKEEANQFDNSSSKKKFDFIQNDFFPNSKEIIIIILTNYPFDRQLLIYDGLFLPKTQENLQNQQNCDKMERSQYFQLASKYIYISNIMDKSYPYDKNKILSLLLSNFINGDISELRWSQKLKRCYISLVDYSLANKLVTTHDFLIFKLNITSAIITQAYSEDELVDVIKLFISLSTSFIRKIRIFIIFLQGIQQIKTRYYSKYQNKTLMKAVLGNLRIFIDSQKNNIFSSQQSLLFECLQIIFLPTIDPNRLLNIYLRIGINFYLYHISTREIQSAMIELWSLLVIYCKMEGIKQSFVINQILLSKLKSLKKYEIKNHLIGSELIFTNSNIFYNIIYLNDQKQMVSQFVKKIRIQEFFTVPHSPYDTFIQYLCPNNEDVNVNRQTLFEVINIYGHCKMGKDIVTSMMNILQNNQKDHEVRQSYKNINLQKFWYGITLKEYEVKLSHFQLIKIHSYNQLKLRQIVLYLLSLADEEQFLYHKHQTPFKITTIMNMINQYQKENSSSISQQIQKYLFDKILLTITKIKCIQCKFYAYSLYNMYRVFMKPKIQLAFEALEQHLLSTILMMVKTTPFTNLFTNFLYCLLSLIQTAQNSLYQLLGQWTISLLFQICKSLNSFEFVFTIFRKPFGLISNSFIEKTLNFLWKTRRISDAYLFIQKICEYIQKLNNNIIYIKDFTASIVAIGIKLVMLNQIHNFQNIGNIRMDSLPLLNEVKIVIQAIAVCFQRLSGFIYLNIKQQANNNIYNKAQLN